MSTVKLRTDRTKAPNDEQITQFNRSTNFYVRCFFEIQIPHQSTAHTYEMLCANVNKWSEDRNKLRAKENEMCSFPFAEWKTKKMIFVIIMTVCLDAVLDRIKKRGGIFLVIHFSMQGNLIIILGFFASASKVTLVSLFTCCWLCTRLCAVLFPALCAITLTHKTSVTEKHTKRNQDEVEDEQNKNETTKKFNINIHVTHGRYANPYTMYVYITWINYFAHFCAHLMEHTHTQNQYNNKIE